MGGSNNLRERPDAELPLEISHDPFGAKRERAEVGIERGAE